MVTFAPDNLLSGPALGPAILQRMLLREQLRLQGRLLQALAPLPVSHYLVLCGSAALHGVYLHLRPCSNLDFYAPYIVVKRFRELVRLRVPDLMPLEDGNSYRYALPGRVMPIVQCEVRLFTRDENRTVPEVRPFGLPSEGGVPVRVLPLEELLTLKGIRLTQRHLPIDYLDFWLGMHHAPEQQQAVIRMLGEPDTAYRLAGDTPQYGVAECLRALEALRASWESSLAAQVYPIPAFDRVRQDVNRWLSSLSPSR